MTDQSYTIQLKSFVHKHTRIDTDDVQTHQYIKYAGIASIATIAACAIKFVYNKYSQPAIQTRRLPAYGKHITATGAHQNFENQNEQRTAINAFIQQAYTLNEHGIHIADARQLFMTIDAVKQTYKQPSGLCVITSFDGTLTKPSTNSLQSSELLQSSYYLPATYTTQYKRIVAEHNSIYVDTDDRIKHAAQLKYKLRNLLLQQQLSKCVITEAVAYSTAPQHRLIQLRSHAKQLLDLCQSSNIPVIINSNDSYIDIVGSVLQHSGTHVNSNVHIHGQRCKFNTMTGQLASIVDEPLTSATYATQHNYRSIVLITDDLNDARLVDDYNGVENVIRIGVCDCNDPQIIKCYMQEFDIVITSKSLAFVSELLQAITH